MIYDFKNVIIMSISSLSAARKICTLSDWRITNLSVQKIIYFCHMVYLGRSKKPLIEEVFEAWIYGPVLPRLYERLKQFGPEPIDRTFYKEINIDDQEINNCLEEIASILLKKKPWQLVTLTHGRTGAWAKNYTPGINRIIPNKDILEEYRIFNERYK